MHRDPLQNVAGTSSTASIENGIQWHTESRTLDEPPGMTSCRSEGWLSIWWAWRKWWCRPHGTHLILMRYCANATASGFPVMVMVRSVAPPSLSSQLLIRIMAPEIWRISAILVPPFPMMQPISSFGTVISCVWLFAAGCCLFVLLVRSWLPANAANAVTINCANIRKVLSQISAS